MDWGTLQLFDEIMLLIIYFMSILLVLNLLQIYIEDLISSLLLYI